MSLTKDQNIPERPIVHEPWTVKRLFPFSGAVATLAKVFVSPFHILLGFIIFFIGLVELFGRDVSWGFYLLAISILVASIFERDSEIQKSSTKKDGK